MFEDAMSWSLHTPDEARHHVSTAAAVAPRLATRSAQTAQARRLLNEHVELLSEQGLFRTLQPRRCGGYEHSLHTHLDVVEEIARGCGSSGWVVSLFHTHSWLAGLFAEAAQNDVYRSNDSVRLAAGLTPRGTARCVDGGFLLSGIWPFCSGCHHADWLILGEMIADHDGEPSDSGLMLVPRDAVTIQDDWSGGGLAGTGSNGVATKDLFVPAHRFLSIPRALEGQAPGVTLHATTLYYSALIPVVAMGLAAPALGMARRALEHFEERLPGRTVSYTFNERQIDAPATHMTVAESVTKLDAARTLLHASVDAIELHARRREVMPLERRAKARMDIAFAARLCLEAVQPLYLVSGGSGLAEAGAIHQAQRDLHAVNMHGLLSLQTNLEMYGRVLLGLPTNSPFI
jgi:3-hydroxy-9,10-secoandrosta-1,3,5(10)-triene-9,17-dione monooxygenase